jgi:hypothetical protein
MLTAEQFGETGIGPMYARAQSRQFSPDRQGALEGAAKLREVGDEFKNIFGDFSTKIMANLRKPLENLLSWLGSHHSEIEQMITNMADLVKAIVDLTAHFAKAATDPKYQDPTLAGHPLAQGIRSIGGQGFESINAFIVGMFRGQKGASEYRAWFDAYVASRQKELENGTKVVIENRNPKDIKVSDGMKHVMSKTELLLTQ